MPLHCFPTFGWIVRMNGSENRSVINHKSVPYHRSHRRNHQVVSLIRPQKSYKRLQNWASRCSRNLSMKANIVLNTKPASPDAGSLPLQRPLHLPQILSRSMLCGARRGFTLNDLSRWQQIQQMLSIITLQCPKKRFTGTPKLRVILKLAESLHALFSEHSPAHIHLA
jgi:hypothetical protein